MSMFPSIRIEGGLFSPDLLDQIVAGNLPGQKPSNFGLDARRNLTDEIASAFADARALWGVFQHRLARLPEEDLATTVTRDAWAIPFLGLFGHELRYNQRAYEVDGLTFAISHRDGEGEDAPSVHIVGARQELGRLAPSGRPRLAPHSLVQEYLNRTEQVWGIVTNGLTLRLLRDSTFVRRQAYVEFDLQAIFEEKCFTDFAAFYRLIHRTRLPRGLEDAADCFLEQYYIRSVEQGGRVRDHLRDGVEECIAILARGFLSHPANEDLRRQVKEGQLTAEGLYRQLLKIIYRILFLLVAEDRALISPNPIYSRHYGVGRLRRDLERRNAYSDHQDLWYSLRVLWHLFGREDLANTLDLAPLNGDLFSPQTLDGCVLRNRDLLSGFWHLAWYRESSSSPPRRVNYAALDVEELGSVYESLLEFHPVLDSDSTGRPNFSLVFGSERKTTGSYYTAPELVNELVQSALMPVMSERLNGAETTQDKKHAILSLRVCDPACGSGHFLLAAARRMGKELARVETGEEEPAPERAREAVREVISHCIYGVDKNPLAVDLCRVALWIESHTGGKPLTFLDHRILCGDSLIGVFDLEILKDGIPDKAFDPLEGDDKIAAREALRRNRTEKEDQFRLFRWNPESAMRSFEAKGRELDAIADDTPEQIRHKKNLFEVHCHDPAWMRQKGACDLWTAAFFQRLNPNGPIITSESLFDQLSGRPLDARLLAQSGSLAFRHRFFHWPLEFPEVFGAGGFDVILSNPPWEHVELKEQEFFAARDAEIANASNKAARARLIRELPNRNPTLYDEFIDALRGFDAARGFLGKGGRYSLTGRGRINTYAVFAEMARFLVKPGGRSGIIVPSGIATDDTTKYFFQDIVQKGALVSLFDFENRKKIFPAIDSRIKFSLLTCARRLQDSQKIPSADFVFFALSAADLQDSKRRFTLTREEIVLLNPNTGNCPIFRSRADAELTKAIYRRVPVLWREAAEGQSELNSWQLSFLQGLFNMASDSHHFRTAGELVADGYRREGNVFISPYDRYLPLYEAKMVHQFDHRWATYEDGGKGEAEARDVTAEEKCDPSFVVQPRYWVREEVVESAIPKYPEALAKALDLNDCPSIRRVLCLWAAGHLLNQGDKAGGRKVLDFALQDGLDRAVARLLPATEEMRAAPELDRLFPLTNEDAAAIIDNLKEPEGIAADLVRRFSPKWFLGFRRVSRTTDERSAIFSLLPKVAMGDSIFLMLFAGMDVKAVAGLAGLLNTLSFDYLTRQKVGGMNFNFFIIRQLPVPPPNVFKKDQPFIGTNSFDSWLLPRFLEVSYTARDLMPLAQECGYDGPSFPWNEARRSEIRCELDAAFFHLYLPCEANGDWRLAENESREQLAEITHHFPTPRDAVTYILDQFPIVRQNDEQKFGRYRTKERILEIYDAMLLAQRTGQPFLSNLNPPPGTR